VRSAAFCLGVLQGLDAVNPNEKPQVIDAVDCISSVSGGGYIGASFTAGVMQSQGRFPFESKLDKQETLETKHIRDNSNYLVPNGFIDVVAGLVAIVRGLLINAMIFLTIILALAALTVGRFPSEKALRGELYAHFIWLTIVIVLFFFILQIVYAMTLRPRKKRRSGMTLALRESTGGVFGVFFILCALASFIALQPYVLAGLFDAAHLNYGDESNQENHLGKVLHSLGTQFPTIGSVLAAAAMALVTFGNKLAAVVTATRGDQTWIGSLKHWASRFALYSAAIVVPLLLWFTYLAFCYWGIGYEAEEPLCVPSQAPGWLIWIKSWSAWDFAKFYFIAFLFFLALSLLIAPNGNSLHFYYRDRLSRAFLWDLKSLQRDAKDPPKSNLLCKWWSSIIDNLRRSCRREKEKKEDEAIDVDQFVLSSLKNKKKNGSGWEDDVRFAPYLLMNTAVNLEGSDYLNKRGRNADSFFFSPLFVGSEATGYAPTCDNECDNEKADYDVTLATAMAISGAAASANMGASTIPALRFSLAPSRVGDKQRSRSWYTNFGPLYFTLETFGLLDENTPNVYLTDGGHFDNLGLYELFRRRCKVIIATDAEADPALNFGSLIRLQCYARIDLGVRIDLPWEDIRRSSEKITNETPHGPTDDPEQCNGPHVAVGRIEYGENEYGVLITSRHQ
jgi:hypothetical protein